MHEPAVFTLSTVKFPTIVVEVVQASGVEVMLKELVVAVALFASVTLTVMVLLVSDPEDVPLITPVLEFKPRPVGSVPLASANVLEPAPPADDNVNEYGVPVVAFNPVVGVVMESAAPVVTLKVNVVSIGENS